MSLSEGSVGGDSQSGIADWLSPRFRWG